jgi:hypothetical protein
MNKLKLMSLVAVALAAACDPYSSPKGGQAQVVTVLASSGQGRTAVASVAPAASAPNFTITAPSNCSASGVVTSARTWLWVELDRQIDPATVQTSVDAATPDCTPVGGWLSGSTNIPAGTGWYACYQPASSNTAIGGSIVIFDAPTSAPVRGWPACGGTVTTGCALKLPGHNLNTTTYSWTGGALFQGLGVESITMTVNPTPGAPPVAVAHPAAATSATVNITAPACGTAETVYQIERAEGIEDTSTVPPTWSAGDYTVLVDQQAGTTYADAGPLDPTKHYFYRVTAYTRTDKLYPGPAVVREANLTVVEPAP